MGQIQILEKTTTTKTFNVTEPFVTSFTNTEVKSSIARTKVIENANFEPFFDVQVGKVKTGLSLGLRYFRAFDDRERSRFLVYAGFKL